MRYVLVAGEAQGPHVARVALSAAFANGEDVIGIPKAFSRDRTQSPIVEHHFSAGAARPLQPAESFHAIYTADFANASISSEYLLAEISRACTQLPFVNAPFGAEGEPATRNFKRTPAAQCAAT